MADVIHDFTGYQRRSSDYLFEALGINVSKPANEHTLFDVVHFCRKERQLVEETTFSIGNIFIVPNDERSALH